MIVEMRLVDWLTAARLSNDTLILTLPTLPRSVDTEGKSQSRREVTTVTSTRTHQDKLVAIKYFSFVLKLRLK